ETAIKLLREQAMEKQRHLAEDAAEERILDALLPPARDTENDTNSTTRQIFRKKLREGELDDKDIEIDVQQVSPSVEIMAPPGMEEMTSQLQSMFSRMGGKKTHKQKLKVKDALKLVRDEEAARLVNEDDLDRKSTRLNSSHV